MHFLRSIGVLFFWLLAALSVAAIAYQVRAEAGAVVRSWPDINTPPEVVSGEESPSDREVTVASPIARLLEVSNGLVPWLILAAVFAANATLLGLVNVLDHGS